MLTAEASEDPRLVQWFEQEASVVAEIEHGNVVSLLDSGTHEGRPFLVTEFVEGSSLDELIDAQGPLPVELATLVIEQCAEGLTAAHERGILHRDLKPANILLGVDGTVKIADFGLATRIGENDEVRGTPGYIAPEVINGNAHTEQADLFALGALFVEALTGRALFAADTTSQALDRTLNVNIDPVLTTDPRVPTELASILKELLDRDPDKRPLSNETLLASLYRLQQSWGTEVDTTSLATYLSDPDTYFAERKTSVGATPQLEVSSPTTHAGVSGPKPAHRRRSSAWFSTAAAIILGLAGATVLGQQFGFWGDKTTSNPDSLASALVQADSLTIFRPESEIQENLQDPEENQPVEPAEDEDEGLLDELVPEDALSQDPPEAQPESALEPVPDTPPSSAAAGQLEVSVSPWAEVYAGSQNLGQASPRLSYSLAPGEYQLELRHPEFPTVRRSITIDPGQTTQVNHSLWDEVARVRFDIFPYAEVSVDGRSIGTIPPQRSPLTLTPGTHTVRLIHPTLGTWTDQIHVSAGDNRAFRYKMDELLQNGSM